MNPPSSYPYGLPPPGGVFTGQPGVLPMVPPGAAFRPHTGAVMPPMIQYMRPPTLRPATRPPVLPKPAGAPVIVSPAPRLPSVLPPKSLTLYVGKIAPRVSDDVIKALLEACGPVKSWKPMLDPDTQKPKGFGFCEYEDAEGAITALQLLNKLELDGQELLLKYNTATEKYIEQWKANKNFEAVKAKLAKPAAVDQQKEGEDPKQDGTATEEGEREASRENAILERIMGIISEHAERTAGHRGSAADQFLSGLREDDSGGRHREDARQRSSRDAAGDRAERQLGADFARERDLAAKREKELQRAYDDLERTWLRHEREMRLRAEKEYEHERAAARERARQIRSDLEQPDSDAEEEPWMRKPIATSRRAEARRRVRERDEAEDAADRALQIEQNAAKRRRGESSEAEADANGVAHPEHGGARRADSRVHVDINDPIYQAMIAAAKEQPKPTPLPPPPAVSPEVLKQEHGRQRADTMSRGTPSRLSLTPDRSRGGSVERPASRRDRPFLSVFGDEEEDKPKRKLITINYTEEEKKALEQASRSSQTADKSRPSVKEIIKTIPVDKDEVFAYPIKWDAYDEHSKVIVPKLSKWVSKKVAELLAEDESVVQHIMSLVAKHSPAPKMIDTLSFLDKDAEPFVHTLFRMIILETEKAAQGATE